uniref:Enhancer of mRNA-decapping protein 3 n=1 Tax=Elaeophora elaphi TaxID=1147741 RepID=A0A0R3RUI7_9BILA
MDVSGGGVMAVLMTLTSSSRTAAMFIQDGMIDVQVCRQTRIYAQQRVVGMSTKSITCGQVLIDMKTRITSYGPHNGIIVHYGIQQEPSMFWPYVLNAPPNSPAIQRNDTARTFATIHCPTIAEAKGDNGGNKSASPASNAHYQSTAEDEISNDNFKAFEQLRLNVFETDPLMAQIASTSSSNYKSDSGRTISQISKGRVSSTRKPRIVAENVDYHRDIEKASKNDISNQNMREQELTSTTRIDSNLIPIKESFKRTAISYNDHHTDEVAKYDYNQIEKEFANDLSLRKFSSVKIDQKMIDKFTKGQRTSDRDRRFLEHLTSSFAPPSNHQRKQCRSTPNLCEVQFDQREVPEQLYHLYETQDAFGNLLQQFETENEIKEQIPPRSSSLNLSTYHDEKHGDFMQNFGLPLIPENLTQRLRFKEDNHRESEYLHHHSQPSTEIFNDADILRYTCDSLYAPSVLIPTSSNKVQESVISTKSDEIEISADVIKNVPPEKTALEYSEVPVEIPPAMNSQQLMVINEEKEKPSRQKSVKKTENFESTLEELKCSDTDIYSIRSGEVISIKPILHTLSRKSSLRKKVRFPIESPRVIALEHRLLIDDFHPL